MKKNTIQYNYIFLIHTFNSFFFVGRKKAEVLMEGQFLVRQIYEDEITYNLIFAAVEILSRFHIKIYCIFLGLPP